MFNLSAGSVVGGRGGTEAATARSLLEELVELVGSLLAIRGPHTGVRFDLAPTRPITLGRSTECDITLLDGQVSRAHAEIRRQGQTWIIKDLDSKNGVVINAGRIKGEKVLLRNDEIQLGSSLFLFDSDFDLQNATFSDKSVYMSAPHDETVEAPAVASLDHPIARADTELQRLKTHIEGTVSCKEKAE